MADDGMDDARVLRNLAHHLRGLAVDVAHVAGAVCDVTASLDPPPASPAIKQLQKIDALEQSLSDLARLTDALACPASQRDPALKSLQLDTTRALLTHSARSGPKTLGTVDLF